MSVKAKIIEQLAQKLTDEIADLNRELTSLEESLKNETKSSAGDKYETSREMINQEVNKLQSGISLKRKLLHEVRNLDSTKGTKVQFGSMVRTSKLNYLIGAPLGKIECDGQTTYCISQASPLAKELLGKSLNEVISFNGEEQQILEIT